MSTQLIKRWQVNFEDYEFKCFWFPSRWMSHDQSAALIADIDAANEAANPLTYGFFEQKDNLLKRILFLSQSSWCVIYKNAVPCGFVYQYNIGKIDETQIVHFGLVKLSHHPGRDFIRVPYAALGIGNLLNFGPHYATCISHVPAIIDMFGNMAHDLYPSFEEQDLARRSAYKPVLKLLRDNYIVPILNYDPQTLDEKTYRIIGSMASSGDGFQTDWKTVPKSQSTLCNLFVKEWLGVHEAGDGNLHIKDDLIQIGRVDYRWLAHSQLLQHINSMRFTPIEASEPKDEPMAALSVLKLGA